MVYGTSMPRHKVFRFLQIFFSEQKSACFIDTLFMSQFQICTSKTLSIVWQERHVKNQWFNSVFHPAYLSPTGLGLPAISGFFKSKVHQLIRHYLKLTDKKLMVLLFTLRIIEILTTQFIGMATIAKTLTFYLQTWNTHVGTF